MSGPPTSSSTSRPTNDRGSRRSRATAGGSPTCPRTPCAAASCSCGERVVAANGGRSGSPTAAPRATPRSKVGWRRRSSSTSPCRRDRSGRGPRPSAPCRWIPGAVTAPIGTPRSRTSATRSTGSSMPISSTSGTRPRVRSPTSRHPPCCRPARAGARWSAGAGTLRARCGATTPARRSPTAPSAPIRSRGSSCWRPDRCRHTTRRSHQRPTCAAATGMLGSPRRRRAG